MKDRDGKKIELCLVAHQRLFRRFGPLGSGPSVPWPSKRGWSESSLEGKGKVCLGDGGGSLGVSQRPGVSAKGSAGPSSCSGDQALLLRLYLPTHAPSQCAMFVSR